MFPEKLCVEDYRPTFFQKQDYSSPRFQNQLKIAQEGLYFFCDISDKFSKRLTIKCIARNSSNAGDCSRPFVSHFAQ